MPGEGDWFSSGNAGQAPKVRCLSPLFVQACFQFPHQWRRDVGYVRVEIYDASACHPRWARTRCLEVLTETLAARGRVRLVIERDDSVLAHDKRVLFDHVRKTGADMEYQFMRAHEECLLAVPDAVAWCWAKGGAWKQSVHSLVEQVHRL